MNDITSTETTDRHQTESGFSVDKIEVDDLTADKVDLDGAESSERTLRRSLAAYEIGKKLRQLRLKKKIALVDLGKHTGLSASMLSQLENGKLVPTLPTLARIAMVFDVGLDHFFADKRRTRMFSVVRAGERIKFPDRADVTIPSYYFECLAFHVQDKSLQAYLAEFPARDDGKDMEHSHEGAEFVHVLSGTINIHYQDEEHLLNAGDSVYFDASEPHTYRAMNGVNAKALVITTPPRP
jgi:transcriptional regulator with XRE-family HTH domain